MHTGISLGWRCEAALLGINRGLRKKKKSGYKTCPFDLIMSNYPGLCECLRDDFKYFCDPKYLELRPFSRYDARHCKDEVLDQLWIFNTYYNFIFLHESPSDIYCSHQEWPGGKTHFIDNAFENFIIRYNDRIKNFRDYLSSSDKVDFIILRYNALPHELIDVIDNRYPGLNFLMHVFTGISQRFISTLAEKTLESAKSLEILYLDRMLGRDRYQEEYHRYEIPAALFSTTDPRVVIRDQR